MKDFLTTTKTVAPPISILWYAVMIALVLLSIWSSLKYHDNPRFVKAFKWIQIAQLLMLYSWYFGFRIPFTNSLPFYHCRLAMFVVLLLPGVSKTKQYFALLGTFGTIAAFVYPIPDAYSFPHIVILSFIFGHLALLGNSLIYLLNNYDARLLDFKGILILTSLLNGLIFIVNLLTGGDYGFMTKPPLVGDHGLVVNYIIVTLFLACAIFLFSKGFQVITQEKAERRLKIWQK